jgi:hypothetical protein
MSNDAAVGARAGRNRNGTSNAAESGSSDEQQRNPSGVVWWLILGFGAIVVILAAVLWWLNLADGGLPAEIALPLLIVASVMILFVGLASAAIIFSRLNLANREHAMGMPEGSIRAIIALLLILIFAVVSVFLIANADRAGVRTLEKLTQEQADAYPAQDVVSRTVMDEDLFGVDEDGDPWIRLELSAGAAPSSEMAKQLLTVLGTLVVAVAGFYFGSQTVQSAAQQAASGGPGSGNEENTGDGGGADGRTGTEGDKGDGGTADEAQLPPEGATLETPQAEPVVGPEGGPTTKPPPNDPSDFHWPEEGFPEDTPPSKSRASAKDGPSAPPRANTGTAS